MPYIEITAGESAGSVCECDQEKAGRMVAAGVAKITDKKPDPPAPKASRKKSEDKGDDKGDK